MDKEARQSSEEERRHVVDQEQFRNDKIAEALGIESKPFHTDPQLAMDLAMFAETKGSTVGFIHNRFTNLYKVFADVENPSEFQDRLSKEDFPGVILELLSIWVAKKRG